MKIVVNAQERAFLFQKGKFVKMLESGEYHFWTNNVRVQRCTLVAPLHKSFSPVELALFQQDSNFTSQIITQEVPDGMIALHYIDGRFVEGMPAGKYTYWNTIQKHTFKLYDITKPEVQEDIPIAIREKLRVGGLAVSFEVADTQKGLLFYNGEFQRMMDAGRYFFWGNNGIQVKMQFVKTRKQELLLSGQEILTKDKVGIRLNFVCDYRFTDCLKAYQEIDDVENQFRTAVQLTVRDYVSGLTLDELLLQRESIADELLKRLIPKAKEMYIEVSDAGIRDVILPGEIKDIMNTVLIAEKKAQANVITRREEVASTRSLLNTAKLMDENKTLYKLKELEYLERICENVGDISVSGGGDLLESLRELLRPKN